MVLELLDLQSDERRVGVAVAVVFDQESSAVFFPTVRHLPSGGFWDEEDGANDDQTSKTLQDDGYAPGKVALDEVGAIGDGRCGNGPAKPSTVEQTYHIRTARRFKNSTDLRIDLAIGVAQSPSRMRVRRHSSK